MALFDELVEGLCCLPGVGQKSAQRMSLHLLERNRTGADKLAKVLSEAMSRIGHCASCRTFTEHEVCDICKNSKRDASTICVVETPADVLAIEQSASFNGKYFVLMGRLSPLDGIGPEDLGMDILAEKFAKDKISEVILATNTTIEGEVTAEYIRELAKPFAIKLSRIAHGVPLDGELVFVDQGTISHALADRKSY